MTKIIFLTSLILASLQASAQQSRSFVFRGQPTESFRMDRIEYRRGVGTCYDNVQWQTEECGPGLSGEEVCRTVSHGESTPYSCEGAWPYSVPSALGVTLQIRSTLKDPALLLTVDQDREGTLSLKPKAVLPPEVIMGTADVRTYSQSEASMSLVLTTREELEKKFMTSLKDVNLGKKSKVLRFTVSNSGPGTSGLRFILETKKGLFGGHINTLLYATLVDGKFITSRDLVLPFLTRRLGPKELEFEVDLSKALSEEKLKSLNLEVTHTLELERSLKWSGPINDLSKTLTTSVKLN